jgi:hypothetical protein
MWMPTRTSSSRVKLRAPSQGSTPLRHPVQPARLEACPPLAHEPSAGLALLRAAWHTCLDLLHPGPLPAHVRARKKQRERELSVLAEARQDFLAALADLDSPDTNALRNQLRVARSLQEMWHLRAGLFGLVSRELSQHAARERLEQLNRHFPTRSIGSGFAPLDGPR